jgi:HK97 family phage portal protein
MSIKSFFDGLVKKELGWTGVFSSGGTVPGLATKQALYYGIIFSCIDAIATKVSEVEWGLYKPKADGGFDEVTDNPLLDLLKSPNNFQTFTDFMYLISSHIDVAGQSFILPVRTSMSSKRILELQLLDPRFMVTETTNAHAYTELTGYKYRNGAGQFPYQPEELVNILRPNPFDMFSGISTIQMAAYEGTNDLNALKMNNAFYKNGAFPGGVISTDQQMNDDTYNKLKTRVKQAYEGTEKAYKMMFLSHGMKYNVTSPSQKDIQFVEQRKMNRDQIMSIFKVPKSIVAVSEQLNKATAQIEYQVFMSNVIRPRLELIFDKLNRFLIPLVPEAKGMVLSYKDPTPIDPEQTLAEKVASVNVWRTINEVREIDDLDPIEGGDDLIYTPDPTTDTSDDTKETTKDTPKEEKIVTQVNGLPEPKRVKGRENKEYTRKRNQYFKYKEADYARNVKNQYNDLIKLVSKTQVKKGLEDDFKLAPEMAFSLIMPESKVRAAWEMATFLLVLKNNTQIWKTAQSQLGEAYDMKSEMRDTYERILSSRASATAKSMSDTVYKKVKETIAQNVTSGETDLRNIKRDVAKIMGEVAQWKSDQVAVTELAWSYGEAQKQTYLDNNVKEVQWLAASDPCETCAANDGQVVPIGNAFPSGDEKEPVHPGCRCEVLPVF